MRGMVGSETRVEYLQLPADLLVLTRSFGIQLSAQLQRDATVLALAVECTDRHLDALPSRVDREVFANAILIQLDTFPPPVSATLPAELSVRLACLRQVLDRHQIAGPFCRRVRQMLTNSERMRAAHTSGRFVACAVREGALLVEALLLLLGSTATPGFSRFMRLLAGPANLVDKFRDARRDFAAGELAIKPNFSFRLRLLWQILRRLPVLAAGLVARPRVMSWGIASLVKELGRKSGTDRQYQPRFG